MTRKDYKVLANILNNLYTDVAIRPKLDQDGAKLIVCNCIGDITDFLKKDNPRFDESKFRSVVFS